MAEDKIAANQPGEAHRGVPRCKGNIDASAECWKGVARYFFRSVPRPCPFHPLLWVGSGVYRRNAEGDSSRALHIHLQSGAECTTLRAMALAISMQ